MSDTSLGEWWQHYFDADFVRIYQPFLTPRKTAREVASMVDMLELSPGAPVLDLACGWGRHSVGLARLGYRVTGMDASPTLLEQATRRSRSAGVEVEWVQGDVRSLRWQSRFHAVVCLFSSLGYFLSDDEDLRVLLGVREALRPGGQFLLETMHRDLVAREFAERDWWQGAEGEHIWVERQFDAVAGVSHECLRWRFADGTGGEKRHAIRVRSATEWETLLRRAGLEPEAWYGGWNRKPFAHQSPRLIALARRR